MKRIPTKVHGLLDYVFAGTVLALPGLLGWDESVMRRVKTAAIGTLLYSLVTKYEWGLGPVKILPMTAHLGMLDAFVSQRDLTQLIQRCVDVKNVQFAILHDLSDNRFKRLDISDARELVGYDPQDDATEEIPKLRDLHLRHTVTSNAAGGGPQSGIREEV